MTFSLSGILQFCVFFFQSAAGKQVTAKIKQATGKSKKSKILTRRFVGAFIIVVTQTASYFLGTSFADGQVNEITDITMKVLDIIAVYGGSLGIFGFINRKQA